MLFPIFLLHLESCPKKVFMWCFIPRNRTLICGTLVLRDLIVPYKGNETWYDFFIP